MVEKFFFGDDDDGGGGGGGGLFVQLSSAYKAEQIPYKQRETESKVSRSSRLADSRMCEDSLVTRPL